MQHNKLLLYECPSFLIELDQLVFPLTTVLSVFVLLQHEAPFLYLYLITTSVRCFFPPADDVFACVFLLITFSSNGGKYSISVEDVYAVCVFEFGL